MSPSAKQWLAEIEEIKAAAQDLIDSDAPHVAAGARATLALLPVFLGFVQAEEIEETPNHVVGCGIYRAAGLLVGLFLRFKTYDASRSEATVEALDIIKCFANAYASGNLEYLDSGVPH